MTRRTVATWTRAGLVALPLYGVLLLVGTLEPQPDQVADPEGWARFVSSPSYLAWHVAANVVGAVLAVLGTLALGVLTLAGAPRLGLAGLLLSMVGQVLLTVPGTISTFATPAIGEAYLRGAHDVMTLEFAGVLTLVVVVGLLSAVVGCVLLGVAASRSRPFPRWAGYAFAAGAVVFYLLGAALGMSTTGASLPTQPVGAAVWTVASAAMAWAALRRPDPEPVPETSPAGSPTVG